MQVNPYSFMSMSAASLIRFSRNACRASREMLCPVRSIGTSENFFAKRLSFVFMRNAAVSPLIEGLNINSQFASLIGTRCANFHVYYPTENPVCRLGSIYYASVGLHFRSTFQGHERFFSRRRI